MRIKLALSVATLIFGGVALNANETTKLDSVQVVTSASGYEQKITDAPASISVITQEDLQSKPYANLLDAVKDIEGVDIGETTDKSGQGTVSIRGMGADYTLVLIDGKKQNNNGDIYPNGFGGLQFANIPPLSMIERIEVIRGPMSTLYGADAMGGVINIITKKISNEWTGSISHSRTFQSKSYWGDKDTTDFAIMGPIIKDKLGISLRGSFYDNEKSNPQWAKDSFNNNGAIEDSSKDNSSFGGNGKTMDNQNWTFGTGLTFTPNENHTIKANFDIAKQKYDNSSGSVGTVDSRESLLYFDNKGSLSPRVGYAETQRMQREQYSLDWEADWDLGKSTVGVHHIKSENLGRSLPLDAAERIRMTELYTNEGAIYDPSKNSWTKAGGISYDDLNAADQAFIDSLLPRPTRKLESKNTTFNAKYELPLESHFIVVGAEYLKAELTDGVFGMDKGLSNQSKEYYQLGLFAEDSWNIVDPLTLTLGARYDKHEDFGNHVSPRAYLTYVATPNWTFKGGIATGYKTPKTTDLQEGIVGFGGQGTSPMIGNPNLKPEKSVSYEIAAYYEHENKHNFNITLFQNDFKDKIESSNNLKGSAGSEWASLGYADLTQNQNVGEATIKGVELTGKYFILDNLSLKANWTYMDSEIKSNDPSTNKKPLTSSPEQMYNVTLDWKLNNKFNTYLQYSGEIDRFNTRYKEGNEYKDLYYKDYSIMNLGASYKQSKNMTFNARINNLLDKNFMEYKAVAKGSGRTPYYYSQYSNITPERNFWISMNYTF
ncbi:TonB-dependent receptor domain-containing protein [Aliarcobacter skirrowii]|uniref:TonB-dependent receptor n=1 Tax=Aliarcobacter skirrowii CCUG 10374 TaxID=1032239 RepID=A0AAD0SNV4_9BACT|nr:TonB-dependent receptor [Aliarcobacter skirrowii]AXX85578.1 TonB-dependent receptor [Aliarcobacter skirrowii CCUG 10374]KAB0621013.1 TonB-dependent receptor [Aliarcobacter skirrowii CCUG 10374]RXI26186.1 TonB-dependent receptor [Aliarcobacter skirrowii CCUG 10374]SUU95886.1 Colicin I receptor precursor [Aliarcobacter skirrowii]